MVAHNSRGEEIYNLYMKHGSMTEVVNITGMDKSNCHRSLKSYCNALNIPIPTEENHLKNTGKVKFPNQHKLQTEGVQRYIVTSMHNNTPLNEKCFAALQKAAEHMQAQLCIIPLFYKNPSLFKNNEVISWPAEALPYTIYDNIIINDEWMIAGKLHVQATAARPLQGMQGFSKDRSCVVGHARVAWETRATPPGSPAIRQITTGSISIPQYSDTKLGQLADFHHTQGALLIETDGKRTFVRHLRPNTSTGEFYDFEHHYGPDGYIGIDEQAVEATVWGDLHEIFSPCKQLILDFSRRYKPLHTIIHDAIDSFAISHHHESNPLMRLAKKTLGMDKLEDEIASLYEFIQEWDQSLIDDVASLVFVSSNHTEDHILRWMKARDWQQIDGNTKIHRYIQNAYMDYLEKEENARRYVETGWLPPALAILLKRAGLKSYVNKGLTSRFNFPSVNDSYMVHGIELGQHGHKGPNGARGTPGAFRASQMKIIIGHIHSPGIYDGVYVVGTSGGMKMNYNDGFSSWDSVHATIDRLGKRRLFNTIGNDYRLES